MKISHAIGKMPRVDWLESFRWNSPLNYWMLRILYYWVHFFYSFQETRIILNRIMSFFCDCHRAFTYQSKFLFVVFYTCIRLIQWNKCGRKLMSHALDLLKIYLHKHWMQWMLCKEYVQASCFNILSGQV